MLNINIEKSTENIEEMFPLECAKHFDLLAKKRFNFGDSTADVKKGRHLRKRLM